MEKFPMTSLCINILISGVATIKNKLERDFAQAFGQVDLDKT